MIRAIDHVIYVAADLDETVADYRHRGFTVTPGGEHTNGLSYNQLVGLADGSYIELVGFHDLAKAHGKHNWAPVAESGGGWADFALLSDDFAADVKALRPLVTRGPEEGGRVKPDGVRIGWNVAFLEKPLPFLIEDLTPRELRVPSDAAANHANGTKGIARVIVGATDPPGAAKKYETLAARGAPAIEFRKSERDGLMLVLFS